MGLGLAISASIIQEHGGSLTAKDAKDGGAEFVITLPELQKDA
jgi:C4-dicarboxylate-specific signal transduction histidine kinase